MGTPAKVVNVVYINDPILDPVLTEASLQKMLGKLPSKPRVHYEPTPEAIALGRLTMIDEIIDGQKTGKKVAVPFKEQWKIYSENRNRFENVPYGFYEKVAVVDDTTGMVQYEAMVHGDGRVDKPLGWKCSPGLSMSALEYRHRQWWVHLFLQHRLFMDNSWTVGTPGGFGTSMTAEGTAKLEIKQEFGNVKIKHLEIDNQTLHWPNRAIDLNGFKTGFFTFEWGNFGAVRELEPGEDISQRFAIPLMNFTSCQDNFVSTSVQMAQIYLRLGKLDLYR
jgi:hypothetical protein